MEETISLVSIMLMVKQEYDADSDWLWKIRKKWDVAVIKVDKGEEIGRDDELGMSTVMNRKKMVTRCTEHRDDRE